jgi:hypothetical protein
MQLPKEKWWSDTLTEMNGEKRTWTIPNSVIYKGRWFVY